MSGIQIFVQLGELKPYMTRFICQAATMNPYCETVLITDQTSIRSAEFALVSLTDLVGSAELAELTSRVHAAGFDPAFRDGYWVKIFMRFLAIERYLEVNSAHSPVMHFECDVVSFITPQLLSDVLKFASKQPTKVYSPFIDDGTVCPAILIGRNSEYVIEVCKYVVSHLGENIGESDMALLHRAHTEGYLEPLPTLTSKSCLTIGYKEILPLNETIVESQQWKEAGVIFDAAAIGQYLFGIDPKVNRGITRPGYLELRGTLDVGTWSNWRILQCSDNVFRIGFDSEDGVYVAAILHDHAKIYVPDVEPNSKFWRKYLAIANRKRKPSLKVNPQLFVIGWYRNSSFFGFRVLRSCKNKIKFAANSNSKYF